MCSAGSPSVRARLPKRKRGSWAGARSRPNRSSFLVADALGVAEEAAVYVPGTTMILAAGLCVSASRRQLFGVATGERAHEVAVPGRPRDDTDGQCRELARAPHEGKLTPVSPLTTVRAFPRPEVMQIRSSPVRVSLQPASILRPSADHTALKNRTFCVGGYRTWRSRPFGRTDRMAPESAAKGFFGATF